MFFMYVFIYLVCTSVGAPHHLLRYSSKVSSIPIQSGIFFVAVDDLNLIILPPSSGCWVRVRVRVKFSSYVMCLNPKLHPY